MNKNKGFIGLGLILAIIAVLVIGGGAYYLGTKDTIYDMYQPLPKEENQNQNNQPISLCDSNATPSIKVISPNGGETYKVGDKIIVKWKSCNITANSGINISLGVNTLYFTTTNTESYTFTIPTNFSSGNYKAKVELDTPTPTTILDYSDSSFKINNSIACFSSFPSISLSLDSASPKGNITAGSTNIELARFGLTSSKNCNLKINQLTIVDGGPGLTNNLKIYDENNNLIAAGIFSGRYHEFSFPLSVPLVLSRSTTKTLIVKGDIQKDLYATISTANRTVSLNLVVGDWFNTISGAIDQDSTMSLNIYNIGTSVGQNSAQIHSNLLSVVP